MVLIPGSDIICPPVSYCSVTCTVSTSIVRAGCCNVEEAVKFNNKTAEPLSH